MTSSGSAESVHASSEAATLAVVICTRDRPDSLLRTLDSIWRQTRPPQELIVIDDGSIGDEVRERIAVGCAAAGIVCRYERSAGGGLTRSRNQAARIASSEILLYLDDDVTCATDCVFEIAACMADPLVAGVTAAVEEPSFSSASARLYQLGFRLAGWWRVAPRGRPSGPRPSILSRPHVAIRARWLSGAAMALRRRVVLKNPFDENLGDYALGEDRELGYRLSRRYWLIESKRARATHHRSTVRRVDERRLGFMTVSNYVYILRKTCRPGAGDWLLIAWSFMVLSAMHLAWAAGPGRQRHLSSLDGMIEALLRLLRSLFLSGSAYCQSPRTPPAAAIRTPPMVFAHATSSPRSPKRVLFVTNRLEHGGAERMLLALVKRLDKFGVTPLVGCLKDAGPLSPECRQAGVAVFENLLRFKTDAAAVSRIQRIIRRESIDIVVAAHSGGDRMFWSTLAGRLGDAAVVVWSHWFPLADEHHFERSNRALYRLVDAFVAVGHRHRRALIRHEHVPAGRIAVIPNAIELDRLLAASPREEARRRLRLEENQVAVAIIANLRREKRHDVFIRAAKLLAPQHPTLRFLIVGDGPHRDAVQAAAAASGLDHETLRLMGPRDDVPDLLAGIDIVCLCSEQECFSLAMLEAAAAKCAFIGPDTGSLPEFLEHRRTGLTIQPADASGLADAIRELAQDSEMRSRLATSARKLVLERYGIDSMVQAFSDLLTGLPQRRRGRARRLGESAPTHAQAPMVHH